MIPPVFQILIADAAITAIVGNRIYQTEAPQDAVRPYVVFSLISSVPENSLSCVPTIDSQRVQVDCWSMEQTQARSLGKAVRDALEKVTHITFGPWSMRDDETKLYRWSMDADFWTQR